MNIFQKIFKRQKGTGWMESGTFAAMAGKKSKYRVEHAMQLSAVYRCVSCISDAVAQLPIEVLRVDGQGFKTRDRRSPIFKILNSRPNRRMTRYTFLSVLVESMLLDGNAFAYIVREHGEVKELVYVPARYVTINKPLNLVDEVSYTVTGHPGTISAKEMIHLVNKSIDGVVGVSTLAYAFHTLGLAYDAETHAQNFFANGCDVGGILTSERHLGEKEMKDIKRGWEMAHGADGDPNGVAVLPNGIKYQPVGINARDAQLLETRQFNVIEICRFFGVSPVKAFDLSKSSYSTVEATNIGFLTDTLGPLLEKIELEFEVKLFGGDGSFDVRFDVSQLLRADKAALATYYSTMFQIGAYSPNEIRREVDLPSIEGGDENFVQVNLQTLKRAARGEGEPARDKSESLP